MSHWATILTPVQLEAHFAIYGEYGRINRHNLRASWEGRTVDQLKVARHQAWLCNDGHSFMLARSFLAIRLGTQEV
jgi:hypothetical protein